MRADIGYVLSCALRLAIISGVGHGTVLFIMTMLLKKRHSYWGILLYTVCKIVLLNVVIGMVIRTFYSEFYKQTMWMQAIYMIGILSTSVLNFVMFVYTFEGGLVKVGLLSGISDIIGAFFTYFGTTVINYIRGEELLSLTGPVEVLDLGIPFLSFGLLFLVKKFWGSYLEKVKDHELRHKRLIGVLFIFYVMLMSFDLFVSNYKEPVFSYSFMFLVCVLVLGTLIYWMVRYQKNVQAECAFLTGQRCVMEQHFEKLLEEIRIIEAQRSITEQQMGEVAVLDGKGVHRERIASYRESLIKEYKELKAGMYSDDWMLDAVLSSQQEFMEQQGIRLECSAREYSPRQCQAWEYREVQQDLITLLMTLFRWGIKACRGMEDKWMKLRIAQVKNQLIIEYACSWNRTEPIRQSLFKPYLKKHHGTVEIQKRDEQVKVSLIMMEG